MITQTQSRLARKATIKESAKLSADISSVEYTPHQIKVLRRTSPRKLIHQKLKFIFGNMIKQGSGIFLVSSSIRPSNKEVNVLMAFWKSGGQHAGLQAFLQPSIFRIRNGEVGVGWAEPYDIHIASHAIERVSERLGTLRPDDIKRELSGAVFAITLQVNSFQGGFAESPEGDIYAKTPNGIAIAVLEFDEKNRISSAAIVTWISDDMLGKKQRELGWHEFGFGPKIKLLRASDFPVYHPIPVSEGKILKTIH